MYSANRVAKDWSANVEAAPASACSSSPDTLANTASFGRPSSRAGSLTSCNRAPGTTPPPSTSARGCTPGHAFSGLKSASQTLQPSPQNEAAKAHAVCPMLRVDPCRRQATRTPLPCRAIQAACAGARQRLCWGPPPWQPEPRASKASPQTSSKIKVRGPWRRLSNSWTMSSSVWLEMSTTMPKRLPASPSSSAAPPRAPAGACGAAAEACSVETSSARPEGDASDEEATPRHGVAAGSVVAAADGQRQQLDLVRDAGRRADEGGQEPFGELEEVLLKVLGGLRRSSGQRRSLATASTEAWKASASPEAPPPTTEPDCKSTRYCGTHLFASPSSASVARSASRSIRWVAWAVTAKLLNCRAAGPSCLVMRRLSPSPSGKQ
mmetsp:Transcript_89792/g.290079  ORF Transcript_89792/g.290079 Transcript_89792/m.290079 type:complete len:380 (-) Transcript_89792:403-1542(-)